MERLHSCIKMSAAYLVSKTRYITRGFRNCPLMSSACIKAIMTDKIGQPQIYGHSKILIILQFLEDPQEIPSTDSGG